MFTSNSSSSSEDGEESRTPFNAVSAAAAAQRQRLPRRSRISRARAAPEDAEAFAYDEALDAVEQEQRAAPKRERKSRYIGKLVEQVEKRKDELQRVQERRLVKEREEEDLLYEDKERFVTKSYKRQLEERAENDRVDIEEEERLKDGHRNVQKFALQIRSGRDFRTGARGGLKENPVDAEQRDIHETLGSSAVQAIRDSQTHVDADGSSTIEVRDTKVPSNSQLSTPKRGSPSSDEEKITKTTTEKVSGPKPKRGLRRNDENAIDAYRQRYFQRQAKRMAENKKKETGTSS